MGGWSLPSIQGPALTLYRAATAAFYAGVSLIAIGNGLFKPILTVVVGRLPHADEAARTRAFTTFFLYINVGGLLSILLGGWLAQRFGWAWAFGGSALGMLVAIATMLLLERSYLGAYLDRPDAITRGQDALVPATPAMFAAVGVLLLLLVLCSSFSYQSYGFVSLFTAQLVQRHIGGFVVPPSWFTALNPITIMLLTPVLLRVWRLGGPGSHWTTVQHIATALLCMALGFVPLVAAAMQAERAGLANPLWVMAAIVLIACSELLYAPAGMAASTRIAPARLQTLAIGAQGAAIGVGAWLSGQVGALAFESGKVQVMAAVSLAAVAAGAILWFTRRRFAQLRL
jgi:POT family proton-dependent oligopeptide transporter